MTAAGECIHEVAWHVVTVPCWLNADLMAELCMETRVSSRGIAALLLQCHLEKPRRLTLLASWGHCLEPLEKLESHVLLQLKALHEGAWKMGNYSWHFPSNWLCRSHWSYKGCNGCVLCSAVCNTALHSTAPMCTATQCLTGMHIPSIVLAALGGQLGIDHFGVILVITAISVVIN